MEKLHLVRLKKGEEVYEIVVDPDKAMEFRSKNGEGDLSSVLQSDMIFFDAKKGQEASLEHLKALFGTDNNEEIAKEILLRGDVQLSSEYRDKIREQKRKDLINLIHRQGIDPKTNLPHPMTRIEAAFEEAKITISEHKDADELVKDVLKRLQVILPIKFVTKEIEVIIPSQYANNAYGPLTKFGKILKDNWGNDGSWHGVIEIPGGLETDLYEMVNKLTKGNSEIKRLNIR